MVQSQLIVETIKINMSSTEITYFYEHICFLYLDNKISELLATCYANAPDITH